MNLTVVTTVLQLIPAVITAIKAIEDAIPGNGLGEQKLAAIRNILESADATIDAVWPTIEKTIKILVGLFNITIWKK